LKNPNFLAGRIVSEISFFRGGFRRIAGEQVRIEASVIFTELFRGYVGEMLAYDSGSESWCQLRLDHLSSLLL
jgi:hypothetical protein